ncbi:uncharacterized protein FRV6_08284 [Fusarium oxysporum]|uniref:Fungal N-terminal domain-containing protein n=1 Tax=Fusarium oxysporum TaxID=5507 RepID=A0A2H3T6H6_FUSOX|nr:uncharacterized protein FRV6_08284 [Fusarium oxysporum]
MSFGFGVGDFIAVGELCWKIYSRVYKVSRDAPEELRALIQELGNLSNTVNLLNEEVRDREDWIKRAGERRLEYTCKVMSQARETLEKMDRLANKYAELGTGDSSEGSKRSLRIKWNRIKYALEVSSINELRSKFMSYNFYLTLLLQGAQNSSLERIEKQQTKTDIKLEELRNVMISDRSSRESPLLKASLDEEVRAELSAAFLRSAEIGNRPWASIGIDDWLQAGQWWLLKARSQINHLAQGSGDKGHAYINLLKACWILTDIVSIHPQRTHLGASNDRRNDDIRNLSQIAKTSLESFPVFNFQLRDVENNTMKIWLQAPPSSTIAPRLQFSINRNTPTWQTSDGEILFQCFVEIKTSTEFIQDTLEECFLMLEVPQQGIYLNLILKNFAGQDIHKLEDSEALIAILWGFQLFKSAFQPASLTVSMVHSVSVLANWPSRYPSCLPLPGYDLGFHGGSDSLSLLLRTIINDVVKEVYQDRRPSSLFFDRDCLDVKLPLDVFAWKIICWHCEKFAEAKSLLEEFNPHGHLRDSLVQTAFLRLDRDFLIQLVQYLNYEDGWHPHDVLFMVKAALSSDDVEYLSLVLEHVAASVLSEHQPAIFRLVSRRERLEHIDTMIQVIVARPTSIAVMLAFFLCSSDEQGFRDFLHIVDGRGGSFRGKTTDEVDFSHFYPTFVAGCARLIETQSPNILSLYLDTLEGLGIDFHTIGGCKNTKSTQLALLPALVSPYPAFLRILLEREVVVADMPPFFMERVRSQYMPSAREANSRMALVQYPHYSMLHWPLYCAVTLACDIKFVQLLCQHGASLQQEIRGSRDHETKAPRIVCHLSRLSSLENARLAHIDSLVFCHILIHIGTKGNHYGSFQQGHFRAPEKIMEYKETWGCMGRLLFRDSIFSSCSGACERAHNGSWKGNDRIRSELLSRYTEFPDRYPKQLRTQEDWDKWRRDALQILRK